MPRKGYKQSEEHSRRSKEARTGIKLSLQACENMKAASKKLYENGYINPMKDKKRSVESRYLMRISHLGKKQSPETIEKRRLTHVGIKCKSYRKHTTEMNRRKSESMKGPKNPWFGKTPAPSKKYKGCYFEVPNQGQVWLRSSYEFIFATYLVAKQVDFRYECKRFILDAKTYLPDFYLVKEDKFIEVKGYVSPGALQKMKEMSIFHPNIQIEMVTAKEINEIRNGQYSLNKE